MNYLTLIIVLLFMTFIAFQVYGYVRSKKSVGKPIPYNKLEDDLIGKIRDKSGLVYFFSPTCHNCKNITPIINKISKDFHSILLVDISEKLELAKTFSVMGTPSLLFFSKNKIDGFYVGVKSESFILEKLNMFSSSS